LRVFSAHAGISAVWAKTTTARLNKELKGTNVRTLGWAKQPWGDHQREVKCSRVKGICGFPMTDVDWQAAAAEASFGIGDSIATKIGWEHRQ